VKAPRLIFQVAHVIRPDIGHGVDLHAQVLGQAIDGRGQDFNVDIDEWRELSELADLYIFSSIELRMWARGVRMVWGQERKALTPPSKRSSELILASVKPMTSDPWTKSSSSALGSVLKTSALFFELMMAVQVI